MTGRVTRAIPLGAGLPWPAGPGPRGGIPPLGWGLPGPVPSPSQVGGGSCVHSGAGPGRAGAGCTMVPHVSGQQVYVLVRQGCAHGHGHLLHLGGEVLVHPGPAGNREPARQVCWAGKGALPGPCLAPAPGPRVGTPGTQTPDRPRAAEGGWKGQLSQHPGAPALQRPSCPGPEEDASEPCLLVAGHPEV